MDFSDWITGKYIQWRGPKIGAESTISAYARYIGVSQQVMSDWMKKDGKIPRSTAHINILAKHYPDVYGILGLEPPAPDLDYLPDDFRRRLQSAMSETEAALRERGLTGSDPEAVTITIQIFEKWGFRHTSTDDIPDGLPPAGQ